MVGEGHGVHSLRERFLESQKGGKVFRQEHIVCIEPHNEVHRGLGKGEIPRGGKIVDPCKIVDFIGVVRRNFLGVIAAARIGDDDFVNTRADAVQAPRKHGFLVFDDHTQADGSHTQSPIISTSGS